MTAKYQIYRINHVMHQTQLGRSTIYKKIKEGTFPKPLKLGPRASGWLAHEIQEWIESAIKGDA